MAQMTLSQILNLLGRKGGPSPGRPIAGRFGMGNHPDPAAANAGPGGGLPGHPTLQPANTAGLISPPPNASTVQLDAPHTLSAMLAARGAHATPRGTLDQAGFKPDRSVVPEGLDQFKQKYDHGPGGWEAAYNRRQERLALGIHLGPTNRQPLGTGGATPGPGGAYGANLRGRAANQGAFDEQARQEAARRARRLGLL